MFTLGGITFEYDEEKNRRNIEKHGIPFQIAARVFFDYHRIELYDAEHSDDEDRYDTIGNVSFGSSNLIADIQNAGKPMNQVLFVVYTERYFLNHGGKKTEVTRLISARLATNFERGLYYGKRT